MQVRARLQGRSVHYCQNGAGLDVDALSKDFEGLTPYIRELRKKQQVTTQSLEKIEDGLLISLASYMTV